MGRGATSALRSQPEGWSSKAAAFALAALVSIGLGACGGGETQDASEPSGDYPVDVFRATFPNRQRLAETNDLVIGVENSGEETIPNIAVTVFIADEEGNPSSSGDPFSTRVVQSGVADPNRPVWILENKYPVIKGFPLPKGSSPGTVAQTNTFGFGELAAGDDIEMIWRLTPVRAGTYTVEYQVSAGLNGNAVAVTSDGSAPEGKFVITISEEPPEAKVDPTGQVIIEGQSERSG